MCSCGPANIERGSSRFVLSSIRGMAFYFHSSPHKIEGGVLGPRPSGVINGESAVFAANKKFVSLMFLAKWSDLDLSFGSTGGIWFSIEQYPGAFEKIFKGKTGYVYSVKKEGFTGDPRLGLQGVEFIKKTPAKIEKTEYVPDVWVALQQTPIVFVTFVEHMKLVKSFVKKVAARRATKPRREKKPTPKAHPRSARSKRPQSKRTRSAKN